MPRSLRLLAVAISGAGSLLAGTAFAQSGSMPMPPSARDPLPRSETAKPAPGPRQPARSRGTAQVDGEASAPNARPASGRAAGPQSRATSAQSSVSERVDTRSRRQEERQLEIDPRAVAPVMQNGRAGVGMRF